MIRRWALVVAAACAVMPATASAGTLSYQPAFDQFGRIFHSYTYTGAPGERNDMRLDTLVLPLGVSGVRIADLAGIQSTAPVELCPGMLLEFQCSMRPLTYLRPSDTLTVRLGDGNDKLRHHYADNIMDADKTLYSCEPGGSDQVPTSRPCLSIGIDAGPGDDYVDVRDGTVYIYGGQVSCGPGIDTVLADPGEFWAAQADCEFVWRG